jgi:hypothetical protein
LNALKWAGKQATLKTHYRALVKRCKSKDPDGHEFSGTTSRDFQNTLKYVSQKLFTVEFLHQPGIKRLEKELKKGNAIALLHSNPDGTSHYTLFIDSLGENFIAVNAFKDGATVSIVSRNIMKFWTKKSNYLPMAWVLTKLKV